MNQPKQQNLQQQTQKPQNSQQQTQQTQQTQKPQNSQNSQQTQKPQNIFQFVSNNKSTNHLNQVNQVNQVNHVNIICKKVCLFTNARDEKHIREWAAHHLLIGFDKIIIFDHKSKIPLTKVFENFDKRVKIINVSYLDTSIKINLMNKASEIANILNMDWMIYLDADEFIILNKFKGIKQLLSVYNHADSLGVNWLFFGSNHLKTDPDGLILENYTKSELCLNDHLKSFVRPSKIIRPGNPHFYFIKDSNRYFGVNNKNITTLHHINDYQVEYHKSPIYIAHYVNQSEETFTKRKLILPRDDNGEHRQMNHIEEIHNQFNSNENNDPKNKYAEKVKQFLKQYGHEF